jgi:hypothetical protein
MKNGDPRAISFQTMNLAPNPRLQRAGSRLPLSRKPLGGASDCHW